MHKTTNNAALAIETLVGPILQMKNSEQVGLYRPKLCIVMRRNVLFDRWRT